MRSYDRELAERDREVEHSKRHAPRTLAHMVLVMEALWGEDQFPEGPERTRLENIFMLVGAWPQVELSEDDLREIRTCLGIGFPYTGPSDPFHRVSLNDTYRPTLTHMEAK